MKFQINYFFIILLIQLIKTADIYMSTTGNDNTGDGSFSNPYLSLMKCQEMANEGDTVYIMEGTYTNFEISSRTSTYNYIFKLVKVTLHTKSIIQKKQFLILNSSKNTKKTVMDKYPKE